MLDKLIDRLYTVTAVAIAGVFLAASLVLHLTDTHLPVDPAWVPVIMCGFPQLYIALTMLFKQRKITTCLLISIAMIASIAIGELFAAGEVAFIMSIGAVLEELTSKRARRGLKKLIGLLPLKARVVGDDGERMVPADNIAVGDLLRVLPGEALPADGIVTAGASSIDMSVVTGESLPVDVAEGDDVFCGTVNRFGAIDVRVTKTGEDSSLRRLIRLVEQAEDNKAPTQRIADRWASILVPVALFVALAVGAFFKFILPRADFLTRAVTILVVFCPCSLAMATPTAIVAAIGQAARNGVIVKSGAALELMGSVDIAAFDKTGTLTQGRLSVSDIIPADPDISDDRLLSLAASAEAYSEHPLGRAIVEEAHSRGVYNKQSDRLAGDFTMIPGRGIIVAADGQTLLCGSAAWLTENGVTPPAPTESAAQTLSGQGKAVIYVASNGVCIGVVALSDTPRPGAGEVISTLRLNGVGSVMLTGDSAAAAQYFARNAGIEQYYAELLPEHKVDRIAQLRQAGHTVCLVGDGVNDAPALKSADVGVAMGSFGSDIAVEAADIALTGDDLSRIPYLKKLANATVKSIKFNIALSMTINFAAIILSTMGVLNPVTGALVHNAGSILVVLNAAALYDRKIK